MALSNLKLMVMPDKLPAPKITAMAKDGLLPNPKARLKAQFHEVCRFRHVALRTEEAYWAWVVRLVRHFTVKCAAWTTPRSAPVLGRSNVRRAETNG